MTSDAEPVTDPLAIINRITDNLSAEKIERLFAVARRSRGVLRSAPAEACRTCPWRRENADSEDPFLNDGALVAYWASIRDGQPFACHKTVVVPELLSADDRANGWQETPEDLPPRECAGALAQQLKEERLRNELGSNQAYFDARGHYGMTAQGFEVMAQRRTECASPPIREPANLGQYGRGWFPDPDGNDTLPIEPPCSCPVCQRHEEVHAPAIVTPPHTGEQVSVDAALAPLLEALWRAGAVTLASCENLREAVAQLWGSELERLETTAAEGFNYQHVVREGLAFVRGVDSPVWEPLAFEVERLPKGQVMRWGPGIQLGFPLEDVERLAALAAGPGGRP